MKHTPGPWGICTIKDNSGDSPFYEYRIRAFLFGLEAGPVGVGTVDRPFDAHLIAAAPELLDALTRMVARFGGADICQIDRDVLKLAREIIARAEKEGIE